MASVACRCPHVKTLISRHFLWQATRFAPIRCRRWSCSYCRHVNLKKLIRRIKLGNPTKLLTLTSWPRPGETAAEVYDRHRPQIRRLIQLIRRTGVSFEACIICEQTVKGMPHWHLVCKTHYLPQKWLSDTWLSLTGSRVVDIRSIKNPRHAACYVAKYVVKNAGHNRPAWMKRTVGWTVGYPRLPKWKPPDGWVHTVELDSPDTWAERYRREGADVYDLDQGYISFPAGTVPRTLALQPWTRPPPTAGPGAPTEHDGRALAACHRLDDKTD